MEVAMRTRDDIVHTRRAREADAEAIARVHVATWRGAYRDQLPPAFLDALSVEHRAEWWSRELRVMPAERRPWIAETRDGIVGFAACGASRDPDAVPGTGEVYA